MALQQSPLTGISVLPRWPHPNTEERSGLNSAIGDLILADKMARPVGNILRAISVYSSERRTI
jgi:hypothetical protein